MNRKLAKAKVLQAAKLLIETDQCPYICWALSRPVVRGEYGVGSPERLACLELMDRIADGLGGRAYLDQWLEGEGIEPSYDQMKLCRMAWIDKLIEEFSHEH